MFEYRISGKLFSPFAMTLQFWHGKEVACDFRVFATWTSTVFYFVKL